MYTVNGIGVCDHGTQALTDGMFSDEDMFYKYGPITAIRGWTDYYLSG